VHYGHLATRSELRNAADISCRDEVRLGPGDVGEFAVAQRCGDLGLQQVIGSRGTAAEMPLGHVDDIETRGSEQFFWSGINALPMLHRTS